MRHGLIKIHNIQYTISIVKGSKEKALIYDNGDPRIVVFWLSVAGYRFPARSWINHRVSIRSFTNEIIRVAALSADSASELP
jgi:hypothetical protein